MAVFTDALITAAAGFAGTKAMEQVASRLMAAESEADQQREQKVRPGPPLVLAARNLAHRIPGRRARRGQADEGGHGLPLQRRARLGAAVPAAAPPHQNGPVAAGLATGASLLLDEIITPTIGASAPNREYPLSTHLRGLAAHVTYGLAIAAVTELAWKATGTGPR